METIDRRRHRRLPMRLDLSWRPIDGQPARLCKAHTVNVASGGLYFESDETELDVGNLAEVRLSIPPKAGVLELGGTISVPARVVRVDNMGNSHEGSASGGGQGVAVEFCLRPRLCM